MSEFRMPKLGADMDMGKLVAWRKQPGEAVAKGDILAEVETDKAEVDVESFQAGVLEWILVHPGERVPVGTVLAILKAEGEGPAVAERTVLPEASRIPISPAARRRALELGVDPATLKGTGPGGGILLEDVEPARAEKPQAAVEDPRLRMRRAIAAAMSRSNRDIPHYYLAHTMDLGAATAWMREANAARPVAERLLLGILRHLAPEGDFEHLQDTTNLREELDLDSVDFLNFIIGLSRLLQVDVPEKDYRKLATLGGALDYLEAHPPSTAPRGPAP